MTTLSEQTIALVKATVPALEAHGEQIVQAIEDRVMAELDRIHEEVGAARIKGGVFPTAARLFEQMSKSETFDEFLTLPAYELLS